MDRSHHQPEQSDPALARGLTQPRMTRGQLLKGAGVLGAGALLSACGVKGTAATKSSSSSGVGSATWWQHQRQTGTLDFANWPLYIDTDHGKHPSLQQFSKQTGIKVN